MCKKIKLNFLFYNSKQDFCTIPAFQSVGKVPSKMLKLVDLLPLPIQEKYKYSLLFFWETTLSNCVLWFSVVAALSELLKILVKVLNCFIWLEIVFKVDKCGCPDGFQCKSLECNGNIVWKSKKTILLLYLKFYERHLLFCITFKQIIIFKITGMGRALTWRKKTEVPMDQK